MFNVHACTAFPLVNGSHLVTPQDVFAEAFRRISTMKLTRTSKCTDQLPLQEKREMKEGNFT